MEYEAFVWQGLRALLGFFVLKMVAMGGLEPPTSAL